MWGAGAVTVAVAAPTIVRRIGDPAMLRLGAGAATVAVAVGAFLVFRRIGAGAVADAVAAGANKAPL
jgi:hypothetical protein